MKRGEKTKKWKEAGIRRRERKADKSGWRMSEEEGSRKEEEL